MPPVSSANLNVLHRGATRVPIVSTLAETQVPASVNAEHPSLDIPRPTSQANLYTTPSTDRMYPKLAESGSFRLTTPQTSRTPILSSMASPTTHRITPSPLTTTYHTTSQPKHRLTAQHSSYPSFDWSSAPRPVKYAYIPPNKNVSYKATATAQ